MTEDLEFKKSDFDYAGQERDLGKPQRKIYKRRKLSGLKSAGNPVWVQLGDPEGSPLSYLLFMMEEGERLHLCGSLEQMTREYMQEPLDKGWEFGREFVYKHRTAVYRKQSNATHPDYRREVYVKLISHRESWLPGCEDMTVAIPAWRALDSEWQSTGLPLLSSPAATGKALLWETLPLDKEGNPVEFPALPDDLARLIRSITPQHRIESVRPYVKFRPEENPNGVAGELYGYDGRWMYAAMCGLDRFPIGEPRRVGYFNPFEPGWHCVRIKIPDTWNHVGLIPVKRPGVGAWDFPSRPGFAFDTWAAEPELTLALKHGWEIVEHYDGYAFDKGRPLALWSKRLIEMRERLQAPVKFEDKERCANARKFAAAAIRQILNSTIGSIHKNEYEREQFISDDNFRQWRREHPDLAESTGGSRDPVRVEGGYMVPTFVPDTSRLSIFMPHWSATIYSLARARVVEWALKCKPETLVKINGDAIYSTVEQPELDRLDTQRLGQPRRK